MPTSEMNAVPRGSTRASAVGTWVWVPTHGADAAVEVPAHRHLLAGHLGVEVDEERVGRRGRAGRAARRPRGNGERAARSWTWPIRLITATRIPRRLDDGVAATRVARP